MYTLLVCCDLYGEKINLELTFPTMPTIGELQRKITDAFNQESHLKRPQGYPAIEFTIARLQIYDDVLLKWADLVTCTQLHEYDQLYVFQPQSPWHIDVQKDLPPPRPPAAQTVRAAPAAPAALSAPPAGAASGHGYAPYYAAAAPAASAGRGRSPVHDRLAEQRAREDALRAELARVHEETARLEAEAERDRAEAMRREEEEQQFVLRAREAELQRQRDALRQAEEDYRRAQEEIGARRGANYHQGTTAANTARPLYR